MTTESRVDLISYLHSRNGLKGSTFVSLRANGFDTNDCLLAMDLDKDLSQISLISLGQRALLRRTIKEYKTLDQMNDNPDSDQNSEDQVCDESRCQSRQIVRKIKDLLDVSGDQQMCDLKDQMKRYRQAMICCRDTQVKAEDECRLKDIEIKRLETEIFRLKKSRLNSNEMNNNLSEKAMNEKKAKISELKTVGQRSTRKAFESTIKRSNSNRNKSKKLETSEEQPKEGLDSNSKTSNLLIETTGSETEEELIQAVPDVVNPTSVTLSTIIGSKLSAIKIDINNETESEDNYQNSSETKYISIEQKIKDSEEVVNQCLERDVNSVDNQMKMESNCEDINSPLNEVKVISNEQKIKDSKEVINQCVEMDVNSVDNQMKMESNCEDINSPLNEVKVISNEQKIKDSKEVINQCVERDVNSVDNQMEMESNCEDINSSVREAKERVISILCLKRAKRAQNYAKDVTQTKSNDNSVFEEDNGVVIDEEKDDRPERHNKLHRRDTPHHLKNKRIHKSKDDQQRVASILAEAMKQKVVLIDDNEKDVIEAKSESESNEFENVILSYPDDEENAIQLIGTDIMCLNRGEYLNDNIVNFYLRHYMKQTISEDMLQRTHIFDTLFFMQLTEKLPAKRENPFGREDQYTFEQRYNQKLKNWTNNIDLFGKDFLIFPIIRDSHWFLAIVCYPKSVLSLQQKCDKTSAQQSVQNEKRPCIIFMDSLGNAGYMKQFSQPIREFLSFEWKEKNGSEVSFNAEQVMKDFFPRVPNQINSSDCGLFMLEYIEQFLKNADNLVKKVVQNPNRAFVHWFRTKDLKDKRHVIREIFISLVREESSQLADNLQKLVDDSKESTNKSEKQFSMSIADGRAKRKRVAPTRFQDEYPPLKKKAFTIGGKPAPAANGETNTTDVTEKTSTDSPINNNNAIKSETEVNITKIDANGKQMSPPLNACKSIRSSALTLLKLKTDVSDENKAQNMPNNSNNIDASDKSDAEPPAPALGGQQSAQSGAPCSLHCPGRRGILPNLMCSRCFCLYHLDCVPGLVFLEEPRVFVCPNCLKPEDTQKAKDQKSGQTVTTNGTAESNDEMDINPLSTDSPINNNNAIKSETEVNITKIDANGKQMSAQAVYKLIDKYIGKTKKSFKCNYNNCGKTFIGSSSVKEHVKRHLGIKLYECEYNECKYKTVALKDLKRHLSRKHKNK